MLERSTATDSGVPTDAVALPRAPVASAKALPPQMESRISYGLYVCSLFASPAHVGESQAAEQFF